MARQRTWRDVPRELFPRFMAEIHRPGVQLAVQVGLFQSPFEYLKSALGGFDDATRFLLNRTLAGDADAVAVRDWLIAYERYKCFQGSFPEGVDPSREYFARHHEEWQVFRRQHYPWIFSSESNRSPAIDESHPETDALLDQYVCDALSDYGFSVKTRRFTKNYWRCHSAMLSHRIVIEFDKGSYMPSTVMTGTVNIEALNYGVSIGHPFFFSGNDFRTSKADDVHAQLHRFFAEYIRIFPHVITALRDAMAAADEFLTTLEKNTSS
ncbi:MAG TPA: hypothetical protein VNL91_00650 [Thermoanaerobaculia bacterium]|nr:hypothetical protein [Thermoanaerobaculia bacterium]